MDPHPEHGTHRRLDDFRIETIGRSGRAENVADAEPVGQPDDRSQIAGVLHIVEQQCQRIAARIPGQVITGHFDERQRIGRRPEQAETLHVAVRDRFGLDAADTGQAGSVANEQFAHGEIRSENLAHELGAFGDEQARSGASLFRGERTDESDFRFGRHGFPD